MGRHRETYWYALKVFFGRTALLKKDFALKRYQTFSTPVVPSLLFVRCTAAFLQKYKFENWDLFMYYTEAGSKLPGRVEDHEMEIFMKATSAVNAGEAEFLGCDTEKYAVGDKVRITQGQYKGYEGYIRRIKHDRKLLVMISGVAVVAFSNIDPDSVERIAE